MSNYISIGLISTLILINILIIIGCVYLVFSIRSKSRKLNIDNVNLQKDISTNNINDYSVILSNSVEFLNIVKAVITIHLQDRMKQYNTLNGKYDFKKLDEDMSYISNKVYESIQKKYIDTDAILFNSEYVMHYIVSETLMQILVYAKNNHDNLES